MSLLQLTLILHTLCSYFCTISAYPVTSKPLENNPEHLTWEAWLMVDSKQPTEHEKTRKITPKSIFITPNLNNLSSNCPPGYKIDARGQCIQIVNINPFELLALQLQNKFSSGNTKVEVEEEYDYDYDATGPFQVNIPLGVSEPEPPSKTVASHLIDLKKIEVIDKDDVKVTNIADSNKMKNEKEFFLNGNDKSTTVSSPPSTISVTSTMGNTVPSISTTAARSAASVTSPLWTTNTRIAPTPPMSSTTSKFTQQSLNVVPLHSSSSKGTTIETTSESITTFIVTTDAPQTTMTETMVTSQNYNINNTNNNNNNDKENDKMIETEKIKINDKQSSDLLLELQKESLILQNVNNTTITEIMNGGASNSGGSTLMPNDGETDMMTDFTEQETPKMEPTETILPQTSTTELPGTTIIDDHEAQASAKVKQQVSIIRLSGNNMRTSQTSKPIQIVTPARKHNQTRIRTGSVNSKITTVLPFNTRKTTTTMKQPSELGDLEKELHDIQHDSLANKNMRESLIRQEEKDAARDGMDSNNRFIYHHLGANNNRNTNNHNNRATQASAASESVKEQLKVINKLVEESQKLQQSTSSTISTSGRVRFPSASDNEPRTDNVRFPGPSTSRIAPNMNRLIPETLPKKPPESTQRKQPFWPLPSGWEIEQNAQRPLLMRFWSRVPLKRDPITSRRSTNSQSNRGNSGRGRENSRSPTENLYREVPAPDIYKVFNNKNWKHNRNS